MAPIGAPGLVAPRRSTAIPRLNLPMSKILTSRSPPPGALTTFWISSALTTVATSFCPTAADGASTTMTAATPRIMRCIAASLPLPYVVSTFRWTSPNGPPEGGRNIRHLLIRRGQRQPQNLRGIGLEQLRELLLGEPVRAQRLCCLGERIRLKVGVDLAGIGRHECVVDAGRANAFDVLLHHLRARVLVAELRREFRIDLRPEGHGLLDLLRLHVDDVEQRMRDDDVFDAGPHRLLDHHQVFFRRV